MTDSRNDDSPDLDEDEMDTPDEMAQKEAARKVQEDRQWGRGGK